MLSSKQRIRASEFAEQYGFTEDAVISRIRKGIYDGVFEEGTWYVRNETRRAIRTQTAPPDPVLTQPLQTVTQIRFSSLGVSIFGVLLGLAALRGTERMQEALQSSSGIWAICMLVFGGLFFFASPALYEAASVGVIRGYYEEPISRASNPAKFWIWVLWTFVISSITGLTVATLVTLRLSGGWS